MSLLTTIQTFCERTNLPVPTTIVGTTDAQIRQVKALLEEIGNDLSVRGDWESLTYEATLTTVATESQGAMTTLAPNGFRHIKNETIWDRTNKLPIYGPLTSQDWQATKALTATGPRYQFRIRGGLLMVNPVPTAGYTWAFEYVTQNWISNAAGSIFKQYFTVDSDLILLPETLVLMGLRWKYKAEKGFDFAEDFRTYEMQVQDALGHSGGKKTLSMGDDGRRWRGPGIVIAPGSWPL